MEINVAQLLKLPIGTSRMYQVDEYIEGIEESGDLYRVRGDVKMLRTKEGILVQAGFETSVEGTCSRCLESMKAGLRLQFEEEYYPTVEVNTGFPLDTPPDSMGFTISSNHILSLDEAIRQYMLLSQPMQPLCSPDCVGLCPECGANLNVEKCDCHNGNVDGPFAIFGRLLGAGDNLSASSERS